MYYISYTLKKRVIYIVLCNLVECIVWFILNYVQNFFKIIYK